MSVDDDSLIECCLIFVVPEFFNSLKPKADVPLRVMQIAFAI